ncbi:MAG: acyloxyacyl hydrolase, partial [Flavobacteriaceae bacterium]|nr:acyloxyacyl hydrolase [Flavobacteriaceae bacterium]
MKKIFLFIFFTSLIFTIEAQNDSTFVDSRPTVLGINFDYGFLLKHTDFLRELDDAYPVAVG